MSRLVDESGADVRVVAVFRADPQQVGDTASAPLRYAAELGLPWLASGEVVDIGGPGIAERAGDLDGAVVVVGGGGLGFSGFQENLRWIASRRPRLLVWWGGGRNTHFGRGIYASAADEFDQLPRSAFDYPPVLDQEHFDLVGVRDCDVREHAPDGYRWVPCVSALHPAFDEVVPRTGEVRLYSHKDPLHTFGGTMPVLTNATSPEHHVIARDTPHRIDPADVPAAGDARAAVRFIGGAGVLLTNSYHGAYWAQLAQVPVAVFAEFSTKFRQLPLPVPIVSAEDVRTRLPDVVRAAVRAAEAHTIERAGLLAAARSANLAFAADVGGLLAERSVRVAP
ncbi:hypothetical protein [Umezawaea beigongshangensis]|uniref:hypothetical protein n=1 Tax=Umezawaea beigongshangensis TaxID=2780383 RepID=UPI0018F125D3|nr:hypothetical protein [Umezawaea beigongshangensis]